MDISLMLPFCKELKYYPHIADEAVMQQPAYGQKSEFIVEARF